LEAIAQRGTDEQRAAAQQTLGLDHLIRSLRTAVAQARPRSANLAGAGAMHKNRRIYTASQGTPRDGVQREIRRQSSGFSAIGGGFFLIGWPVVGLAVETPC
jgi:hypothetical protein